MPKFGYVSGAGRFSFPDTMSVDQVREWIDNEERRRSQEKVSYGAIPDVLMGGVRGAASTVGKSLASLSETVGAEDVADWLREKTRGAEDRFLGFGWENPGTKAAEIGEMLGGSAAYAGAGLGAAALAPAAAPAWLVAGGVGSLLGMGSGLEEQRERQLEAASYGKEVDDTDRLLAGLGGAALGATEALPVMAAARWALKPGMRLLRPATEAGLKAGLTAAEEVAQSAGWRGLAKHVGAQALEEAIQEGGTQAGQNLLESSLYNPERKTWEGVPESMLAAGLMGAGYGGLGHGYSQLMARSRYGEDLEERRRLAAEEAATAAAATPPPQTVEGIGRREAPPAPGEPGYITSQLGGDLLGGDIEELLGAPQRPPSAEAQAAALPATPLAEQIAAEATPEVAPAPEGKGFEKVGEMGAGLTESMYNMLWDKVQRGEITEAGQPTAVLQAAKLIRDRGGLQTKEGFVAMAKEQAALSRGEGFQQNMRSLVEKYSPAPETVTPVAPPPAPPPVAAPVAAPPAAPPALAPEPPGPPPRPMPGTPEPVAISNNISDAMYTAAANMGMSRSLRGDLASDISREGGDGPATDLAENALLHVSTAPDAHPAGFWNAMKPRAFEWMKSSNWLNPKEWSLLQRAARQSGNFKAIATASPDMPAADAELLAIRNLMRDRAITGNRFRNGDLERAYQRTLGAMQATGTALQSQGLGTMADVGAALRPSEALGEAHRPGTTDIAPRPLGPQPLSALEKEEIAYAKKRMGGYKPAQTLYLNMLRGIRTKAGGEAEGAWVPNRKVIELAFVQPLENEAPDVFQTRWQQQIAGVFDHEFTHFLRNSDVFEPKQWSSLVREAKKRGQLAEAQRLYAEQPGYTSEMIEEESVANLFRDTANNVAPSSFVRSMWQKILNSLRRAGNGLMGRGWMTADDVMAAIRRGEVAQQQPQYEVEAQKRIQQLIRDQEELARLQAPIPPGEGAYREESRAAYAQGEPERQRAAAEREARRAAEVAALQPGPIGPTAGAAQRAAQAAYAAQAPAREAAEAAAAAQREAQAAAIRPGPIGPTEGQARARARAEERERSGRYGQAVTGGDGREYVWDKEKGGWAPAEQVMYSIPREERYAPDTYTHPSELATRVPTAVGATEDPLGPDILTTGYDSAQRDENMFRKNVRVMLKSVSFKDIKERDHKVAAERIINRMSDTLKWLHDDMPEDMRDRARLWYDGANRIAKRFGRDYKISNDQAAGVLAVFSPQKDWFQNVGMGERMVDFWNKRDELEWNPAMTAVYRKMKNAQVYSEKKRAAKKGLEWVPKTTGLDRSFRKVRGKRFSEITDPHERAVWFRMWEESTNPREYQVVTPEGDFSGTALKKNKKDPARIAWSSFSPIKKAMSILEDGSRENIHKQIGNEHKVRSFYANILVPNSERGNITMDTHAVAAALLRALSGKSREVMQNFGSAGSSSSSFTGESGTYAIIAEAYKRAAKDLGILPRELQSITWEAVRGLFRPEFKSQKANVKKIDNIWNSVNKGIITREEAYAQILKAANGITPPDWHVPNAGQDDRGRGAADTGGVPGVRHAGSGPGRVAGGGTGSAAPAGVPAPGLVEGAGGERGGGRDRTGQGGVRYSLPRAQAPPQKPPPLSDRILGAASALRGGQQINEGDFESADLAVARKLASDNRVDLNRMAQVNPDEHLNLGKLEMDPRFKEHLRNKVRLAAVALDRHPKKALPFSDIRRAAARLVGGEELLDIPKLKESETLKPEVRLALGITLKELESEIVRRTSDLENNPGMRPEARSAAQQEIDTMDHYLRQIMNVLVPARTQDGRNLVYHRIMAQGNFDRVYWNGRVKRMLGVPPNHDLPADVVKNLNDQITTGQNATKELEDAKVEEQAAEASGSAEAQTKAKQRVKKAEDAVMDTRKDFAKHLAQYQKTSRWQGWNMLWKTGLLTNPYARLSDIGSNLSFAALERLASKPASWADAFMEKKSGERTVMAQKQIWQKAAWEGAPEGIEKAKRKLREVRSGNVSPDEIVAGQMGIQQQYDLGDKPWEQWLTEKTRPYVEGMQGIQAATDMPSRQMAYAAGIREQAQLQALKEHKAGALPAGMTMDQRVNQLISAPTDDMKIEARAMEQFSAFANANWFSDLLKGKQHRMKGTAMGRAVAGGLDWVFPFVKVPSNVLTRVLEFSPLGLGRGAAGAIASRYSKQALDPKAQRLYAQLIGRGSVGSALMLLGYGLAKAGLMSGTRDADDWAGRAADEAAGRPPGAIKLPGGRWAQIGRISPGGNILVAGASLYEQDGELPDLAPRMGGALVKTVKEMPFMQGYETLSNAIESPGTMGQKYVQSQIGSFVPAGVARLAATVDPLQRDTKDQGFWAGALQRLPGGSYALPERRDVLGRAMEQPGLTALGPIFDPFRTQQERSDPVSQAIIRDQPQIAKPQRDKKGGEDIETFRKRAELAGRLYYQGILEALASPEYAEAKTQAERAEILKEGRDAGGRELSNLTTRDDIYKESAPAEKRRMLDDYLSSLQGYAVQ